MTAAASHPFWDVLIADAKQKLAAARNPKRKRDIRWALERLERFKKVNFKAPGFPLCR